MPDSNKGSSGIGFTGLLAILFITLKLTNVITWAWLWVLSPIWIPFALLLILLAFAGLIALVSVIGSKVKH